MPKINTGDPILGAEVAYVGQKTDGSLPNITGIVGIYSGFNTGSLPNGCFYIDSIRDRGGMGAGPDPKEWLGFDASRCSGVYTNGQTRVKSAGVYVLCCIKY